ncbi:rhomboid family intramembrane serine protease [uncultured Microscilla sp.]|uniref:rhomboid family intramembrane serine protease n=1 Tax=uncultured Microscilla sp. TaxID=432653 RepID=UPI002638E7FF|nr:rhomboid family intramembrane serine protease [uncultured Microscilla sp.]
MGNLTPIVRGLLIINVFVFFADSFISEGGLKAYGMLWYVESPNFRPWQLLTHMFLHADFFHLLGNMMGLFFFGPWLERTWGARNFFIFYFACGFGGAALQMGGVSLDFQKEKTSFVLKKDEIKEAQAVLKKYSKDPTPANLAIYQKKYEPELYQKNKRFFDQADRVMKLAQELKKDTSAQKGNQSMGNQILKRKESLLKESKKAFGQLAAVQAKQLSQLDELLAGGIGFKMLGASGAIFGILLAFALFFPNVEMMLLFFPVPIKAKYFVAIYMIFTIYAAGGGNVGMANVAHLAHLGGAIIGFILARFWLWKYKYN